MGVRHFVGVGNAAGWTDSVVDEQDLHDSAAIRVGSARGINGNAAGWTDSAVDEQDLHDSAAIRVGSARGSKQDQSCGVPS